MVEAEQGERKVEFVGRRRVGRIWKVWIKSVSKRIMKSRRVLRKSGTMRETMEGKGNSKEEGNEK